MSRDPLVAALLCAALLTAPSSAAPRDTAAVVSELVAAHGEAQRARITRGLEQLAAVWRSEDGDLAAFAHEQFIADPLRLEATLRRFETTFEQLDGHMLEIGRALRHSTDVDIGPLLPVDPLLGALDASAHLTDDLFASHIASVVLLNFPLTTLEVALVEIRAWHWMYEHPDATPAQLRDAMVSIAREVWNRHYAPVLGGKDSVQLAIYSHMLSTPLYLYNYPIGSLIAVQLEEHFAKQGRALLGREFARMARTGRVTPDLWMERATGAPIGTAALFRATEQALREAR